MQSLLSDDPRHIGRYQLTHRLGAGGMGQVYFARTPAGRAVVIKVIHPQLARDDDFRARFVREVEAARLVGGFHTAQVVDADPGGDPPWVASAHIPGPSLDAAVREHGPLPERSLAMLAAGIAEGLEAIHSHGLVHRDLKPGNIILASDGPRIIDFGIARQLHASHQTTTGTVIGTLSYMSPEQTEGVRVGPASDVFSLGTVLAFAATAANPFEAPTMAAVVRKLIGPVPDVTSLPAELRKLVGACWNHDPGARPSPSKVLAHFTGVASSQRLDHFAEGASSQVWPPTRPYERIDEVPARTPPRSHAPPVSPQPASEPEPAPKPVRTPSSPPPRPAGGHGVEEKRATPPPRPAAAPGRDAGSGTGGTFDPVVFRRESEPIKLMVASPYSALLATRGPGAPEVEIWNWAHGKTPRFHNGLQSGAVSMSFSPVEPSLAVGYEDGTAEIWIDGRRSALHRFEGHQRSVLDVAFNRDGTLLATTSADNTARVWDTATGKNSCVLRGHTQQVNSVVFSHDHTRVATTSSDHTVRVWSTRSGRHLQTLRGHQYAVWWAAFTVDGALLVSTSRDGTARVWDSSSGELLHTLRGHGSHVYAGALDRFGMILATAGRDGNARVWSPESGGLQTVLRGHSDWIFSADFSSEGSLLATASKDGTARVWNYWTGECLHTLRGHSDWVLSVAFVGGSEIATASRDGTARLWTID